MICPTCNSNSARLITKIIDGEVVTRCHVCGGHSEISRIDYSSPRRKQRLQWQREKYAKDIVQPFELRRGEVHKGWRANKDFIKAYKDDPGKLSKFKMEELKESGVVTKKVAEKSREMPLGSGTPKPVAHSRKVKHTK